MGFSSELTSPGSKKKSKKDFLPAVFPVNVEETDLPTQNGGTMNK